MDGQRKNTDAEEILSEFRQSQEPQGEAPPPAEPQNKGPQTSEPQPEHHDAEPQDKEQQSEEPQSSEPQTAEPQPESQSPEPQPEHQSNETQSSKPAEPQAAEQAGARREQRLERDASGERNIIFIGAKSTLVYLNATLTQLASEPVVTIKARGKLITQAVDVSQMIVKRMDTVGYRIGGVRISSDSLTSQDGKTRNVSSIEIDITRE